MIEDLDALPVAVDVQVRRVTEHLGMTDTAGQDLDGDVRQQIQQVWQADVARHGAVGPPQLRDTASALDPALWFFAKWGCTSCDRRGLAAPIASVCDHCDLMPG